jgi:hypothetical protein
MTVPSYKDWKFMREGGMTNEEITKLYIPEPRTPKKETWEDVMNRLTKEGK